MNILYIHQYFKTPSEPGGTRSYWISRELIKNGHNVTMLTTSPTINESSENIVIDGINVMYIKVPYDQKMNFLNRLRSFIDFMIKATVASFKIKDVDLVIATSTPLTIGFPALMLKKLRRVPYLFEVRDLWPEVPIQMGGLNNPLIKMVAKLFEASIYKNAEHIIALSPGMKSGVAARNINEDKISVISNMAKIQEFFPRDRNTEMMRDFGLKVESFKIIHFGSLGIANGAHTILESASLVTDNDNIEFIFIGGGAMEEQMKLFCVDNGLTHVHFLGQFSMKTTSEIVNFCDVSIVSFLDLPILYTNSPNKLFDSLSAGKPIIVNSAGWTKDLVEDYHCGYYVDPSRPADLIEKLRYLKKHPKVLKEMGIASRQLAVNKYDKSILCKDFLSVVEQIA